MQNSPNICPHCQSPIPADAPGGLCPACVLLGVAGPTNPSQATAASAPTIEEVAAAFPELEIIEMIGQGGMGIVFKARQPRLDRLVALKILPPALAAQPGFAERFTREARVLARLAHPHIVAIHDFGESAGFFYLTMEFVNGVNLRAAMRAGVKPEQALLLVPRICEALQFAHDHGVLHRDIKPENILLDTAGTPKLADFGIAKLAGEESMKTGLTATGEALGTAAYMAPEQVEKPATVDHRADIYSLGVVLYEMLTGELPLGRFAAPSEKSSVNRGVDEVVMRALEKERERRQQSAGEMKTEVEHATLPAAAPAVAMIEQQEDSMVTRVLLALTALSAIGIPISGMLQLTVPNPKHMVVMVIFMGTLAGLSRLFFPGQKVRVAHPVTGPFEKISPQRFFGLPLYHIVNGPDPRTGVPPVARGIFASGPVAKGIIAVGGRAHGLIACGGMAVGGLAIGGLAIGGICLGGVGLGIVSMAGMALGLASATGGMAVGQNALGGIAVGLKAAGGLAIPLVGTDPATPFLLWLIANLLLVFVAWTIIPDLIAVAARMTERNPIAPPHNPWPRRIFFLIAALIGGPTILVAISIIVPVLAQHSRELPAATALPGNSERHAEAQAAAQRDVTAIQDEAIRIARERLNIAKAHVESGTMPTIEKKAAERDLAIAEARGDAVKIGEARVAYEETRLVMLKANAQAGHVSASDVLEGEQALNVARLLLEVARKNSRAASDNVLEKPAQP